MWLETAGNSNGAGKQHMYQSRYWCRGHHLLIHDLEVFQEPGCVVVVIPIPIYFSTHLFEFSVPFDLRGSISKYTLVMIPASAGLSSLFDQVPRALRKPVRDEVALVREYLHRCKASNSNTNIVVSGDSGAMNAKDDALASLQAKMIQCNSAADYSKIESELVESLEVSS